MKKYKLLSWVLSLVMALTVFSVPTAGAFANEGEETGGETEGYFCLGNNYEDENGEECFVSISNEDTINIGELRAKLDNLQVDACYVADGQSTWYETNKIIVTNDHPEAIAIFYYDEEADKDVSSREKVTEIPGDNFAFEPRKAIDEAHFTVEIYDDNEGAEVVETIRFTVTVGENDVTQYKLGWYDEENDENVFAGDGFEYSALGEYQFYILQKFAGDDEWNTNEIPKIVWKNSNPEVASMRYDNAKGNECTEMGTKLELTEANSMGRHVYIQPRKPGDAEITADVYEYTDDSDPIATLSTTIHVGSDDTTQYCVGWLDDNGESILVSPDETFDYEKMGIASLNIYEKRPGEDWVENGIPKSIWHSQTSDVAQLCYEDEEGKYQTTGGDIVLGDTGSVTVIPQKVGTAYFSVDVYDDEEATKPVATVPMTIDITQRGLDRGRYEPYLYQCLAYKADFDKQMVYGDYYSIDEYNKEFKGEYPALEPDDFNKLKITATVGGTASPAKFNTKTNTFTVKLTNAKLGAKVKMTYAMGSFSWTDELIVTQWIKPKYTVRNFTYNGRLHTASVTVTYKGKKLKQGTDYNIGSYDIKSVGRAEYYISYAENGKYRFSDKEGYFKINPKGTTLKTPKRGKKQITVKWTRQATRMAKARITGYQIQLATNSKFTKGKKLVTVKGYKNTSKKIKKLKKKTKYFVRIRTYMKVGKYTYYSGWSKYKTVKTK